MVDAAAQAIEDGGYEQMTIRSLAADLGVAPMTLYRHVRDKDDLLDEIADRLLAQSWRPRVSRQDWRRWIADSAERLRRLLVSQPAVLHVYLKHPVASPAAMARMQASLEVLRQGGFDERGALRAYAAVHTYTVGFAALEAARAECASGTEPTDAVVESLAAFTTPRQFSEGLRLLLDGIQHATPGA